MVRTNLDRQLQDLSEQLLQLWSFVDEEFAQGLLALKWREASFCEAAIAYKPLIESARRNIEHLAFRIFTLQQPLGGRDLRFLTTIPAIATELERIAEGGVDASRILLQLFSLMDPITNTTRDAAISETNTPQDRKPLLMANKEEVAIADLLTLGKEAKRILGATLQAFAERSALAARTVWQEVHTIDKQYEHIRDELITLLTRIHTIPDMPYNERFASRITYLLWLADRLERVAGYCATICERTVFIAEGTPITMLTLAS
jgi:phosphate transport system protein